MRSYELVFIVDPRLTEDETVALTEAVKELIVASEGEITKEESWGKRRLAYPIKKFKEGSYVLLHVAADGKNPLGEVDQRLRQNDKILRHLVIRRDAGRLRIRTPDEPETPIQDADTLDESAAATEQEASS
ncbi:MAG: 30S ribosomal protein S6 [Thermoanaerobaculia bacterium]